MEVAKLAAPPNLEVRFISCNESAIKRWLSSELEETVFSLTHELFMSKHHTVTLNARNTSNNLVSLIGRKIRTMLLSISKDILEHSYWLYSNLIGHLQGPKSRRN